MLNNYESKIYVWVKTHKNIIDSDLLHYNPREYKYHSFGGSLTFVGYAFFDE